MWANVSVFCFLASYLVSWGLELSRLLGRARWNHLAGLGFATAGLLAQTIYLMNRAQRTDLPPLLSSAHDWLIVLTWVLVLAYLLLGIAYREIALGAFAIPVVLALILPTYLMPDPDFKTEPGRVQALKEAERSWTMLHASSILLGMGSVAVGLVAGMMYLVQHRRLKSRSFARTGWQMPSLERLAQVNRWSVIAAFVSLTVGFGSGIMLSLFPETPGELVRFDDPVVIVSGFLWAGLTIVVVWQLTHRGQSGRQIALLNIASCGFLLITVVGLKLLIGGSGFHAALNSKPPATLNAQAQTVPHPAHARTT